MRWTYGHVWFVLLVRRVNIENMLMLVVWSFNHFRVNSPGFDRHNKEEGHLGQRGHLPERTGKTIRILLSLVI